MTTGILNSDSCDYVHDTLKILDLLPSIVGEGKINKAVKVPKAPIGDVSGK